MSSRMDKYNYDNLNKVGSRTEKNNNLYRELSTNKITTNIRNLDNNVIEITDFDTSKVNIRHRNSKYDDSILETSDSRNNNFYDNIFGDDVENKNYDVNDILDNAKKNRTEEDEEEKQRRLKSVEYSILSDLSKDKIQEYHDRKSKGISKEEEENLEELINTITSNKLRKSIDDELFSELMPENPEETLISSNLLDELKNEKLAKLEEEKEETDDNEKNTDNDEKTSIDESFYTRSMDLKKQDLIIDFDSSDELDESFTEKKSNAGKIVLIIVLILIILGIIGYCIYSFM